MRPPTRLSSSHSPTGALVEFSDQLTGDRVVAQPLRRNLVGDVQVSDGVPVSGAFPPCSAHGRHGRALDGLGCALLALGDAADAVSAWRRAAELFRELGLPDTVRVEGRLAAAARD